MIDSRHLDLLSRLEAAETLESVWSIAASHLEGLGLDRCIYTLVDATGGQEPLVWTSMPETWINHYVESNFDQIDPYFRYCCRTFAPFGTGIAYVDDYPFLTAHERQLICEGSEAGLRSGFSAPVGLTGSPEVGGWNLGGGLSRQAFERLIAAHGDTIRLSGWYIHQRALALWRQNGEQPPEPLSPRERECLLWLSRGLRSAAIADRLGISIATVELHLRGARRRLRAATREQALAKAILSRQIEP